jgi:hypothetical protein
MSAHPYAIGRVAQEVSSATSQPGSRTTLRSLGFPKETAEQIMFQGPCPRRGDSRDYPETIVLDLHQPFRP